LRTNLRTDACKGRVQLRDWSLPFRCLSVAASRGTTFAGPTRASMEHATQRTRTGSSSLFRPFGWYIPAAKVAPFLTAIDKARVRPGPGESTIAIALATAWAPLWRMLMNQCVIPKAFAVSRVPPLNRTSGAPVGCRLIFLCDYEPCTTESAISLATATSPSRMALTVL
jgi:hypothetical protein